MSDYSRQNDFTAKDALTTGNPSKLIKGSEVDAEFDAALTAINSKVDEPSNPSTADVLEWSGSAVQWAARNFTSKINAIAPATGLHVRNGSTAVSQVRATADELLVSTTSNSTLLLTSVDETAAITSSGANGLDTGTEAGSTWYYLYIIYNGTSTDSLLSLSATSPTLPGGYTHFAMVGAVYNDSSSDFRNFHQMGNLVYAESSAIWTNQSPTTATSIDLSDDVPAIARSVNINTRVSNSGSAASILTLYSDSNFGGLEIINNGGNTNQSGQPVEVPLVTAQTIWGKLDAGTSIATIACVGYRL